MREAYVVIPGYILEKDLTPSEMIICGLIDGFMKKYGFCDLTNETIAKMLHKEKRNISDILSNLYEKGSVIATGTKKNRKLKLNYEIEEPKEEEPKILKDDAVERFDKIWEREPSEKKSAKEEAKKHFLKLSKKKQDDLASARMVCLADAEDMTYVPLLRTFISKKYFEDEKYQNQQEQTAETDISFERLIKKSLAVVEMVKNRKEFMQLTFKTLKSSKKFQNEGRYFDDKEVECLETAVGDMAGLVDQAYDEGNLRVLFLMHWGKE